MKNVPLIENIISLIKKEIENIPTYTNVVVEVNTVNKDVVDCTALSYTQEQSPLTFQDVAVVKSRYLSVPIQEGDIGILLFVNTSFIDRVTNDDTSLKKHNYTFNPLFIPIGVNTFTEDNDIFEIYNILGDRTLTMSNENIIIKDEANTITIDDNGINLEDSNGNTITMGSSSVTINSVLEVKQ